MDFMKNQGKTFHGKTLMIKHDGDFSGEVTIVKYSPNPISMDVDSNDLFEFVIQKMKKYCHDNIDEANFRQLLRMMDLT